MRIRTLVRIVILFFSYRIRYYPYIACATHTLLYSRSQLFLQPLKPPAFCVTSARCGWDDGKFELITGSMIVSPEGHILAENKTDGDELIIADIDLDACRQGKSRTFCFEKHRRPEHYGRIVEWKGVREPEEVA